MTNLVEALRHRVEHIMASLSYHMKAANAYSGGGMWDTYHLGERLVGVLYKEDAISWHRQEVFSGTSRATVYTYNIKPTNLKNQEFGNDIVVDANLQEKFDKDINLAEGAVLKDTISHTFVKTTTREDSYKQGLRILAQEAVRGGAGSTQDGLAITATAEQEFTAEFQQKYGSQEQTSDTLSEEVDLTGPWNGVYSFSRSRNKTQQEITAYVDYEFAIKVADESQIAYNRNPFLEAFGWKPPTRNNFEFGYSSVAEFLSVMKREAPNYYALYQAYMDYPANQAAIEAIKSPPGKSTFIINFDDVTSEDIIVRKS